MSTRFLGHAIHPMLIVFPLGLLAAAIAFDVAYLTTHHIVFAHVAYWNIVGGIIGGLAAAAFGLADWLGIPSGTRAKSIGAWHAIMNVLVLLLFAGSWVLRRPVHGHIPDQPALFLSFAGLILAVISGWLGGELVQRLGVGVYDDADLDATSSVAGHPVLEGVREPGALRRPHGTKRATSH